MDVIGFLCLSPGSSTFYVADAHAHVQRLVSVVEMMTVLEESITEQQSSVVFFYLWAKGLNAKDIRKEMFPAYGGKCLSRKGVHSWVANVPLMTKRLKRRCGSG
jgi:hypothetical protein